jgi:hypothetical protein
MAAYWLEKCVWSPTDKRVAAYLSLVWGDIPTKSWWPSAVGASCGLKKALLKKLKGEEH